MGRHLGKKYGEERMSEDFEDAIEEAALPEEFVGFCQEEEPISAELYVIAEALQAEDDIEEAVMLEDIEDAENEGDVEFILYEDTFEDPEAWQEVITRIVSKRRNSKTTVDSNIRSINMFVKNLLDSEYTNVKSNEKTVTFNDGDIRYRVSFR